MNLRFRRSLIYLLMLPHINACMMGPDYVRPEAKVSTEFKENQEWKQADPRDDLPRGNWWEVFNDATLNQLEEQVASANLNIRKAEAQYKQAEHMVLAAEAGLSPVGNASFTSSRFVAASGQNAAVPGLRNLFGVALNATWQPDLWGGVRRQIENSESAAQSSASTMMALVLSTQTTLAVDYFSLKMLDLQKKLLDETVATFSKTLTITKNRYAVGVAAKSDVVQATAQLESARAQSLNVGIQRAQYEHAIAVLIGKAPAELSLPHSPLATKIPEIPVSLPSELLERRPDIAAAERQISSANALIGVAKAAYYPSFSIGVTDGFQSGFVNKLLQQAHRYWTLGPGAASLSLFDGGQKNAQYKQAIDNYDISVANYRQVVLTAIQQVEDNLAALKILQEEVEVQQRAVDAANEAVKLTVNQYEAGTVSYLNVMTAQANSLTNQITNAQLQGTRISAAVNLITALGGGWDQKMVPSPETINADMKWTDYLIIPFYDQGR